MGVTVLRIIPSEPTYVPTPGGQDAALGRLREWLNGADEIEARPLDDVEFVDCGDDLEGVLCPECEEDVTAWWDETMAESFDGAEDLVVTTPCCEAPVSLNDFDYDAPCGFARFVLDVVNPPLARELDVERVTELERLLGCRLRQIRKT